jgi:predicted RND superfamily exporter protein
MLETIRYGFRPEHTAGYIAALAPFVTFCGFASSTSVNGQVVSSSTFNFIALIGGLIALLCVAISLPALTSQSDHPNKKIWVGLTAGLAVLGALQLVRAFGVFT